VRGRGAFASHSDEGVEGSPLPDPQPWKFHSTILKGKDGAVEVREISLCPPDCEDFVKTTASGGQLIRVSGQVLSIARKHTATRPQPVKERPVQPAARRSRKI
jgi:hypothetical protein